MAHFPPSVRYALFVFLGILILAGFGGTAWFGYQEHREARALASDLASTTDALGASERARREAEDRSASLESSLAAVRRENASFSGQISSLASTVGTLDKLAKTDPELLAKYSKVYFLNENYVPSALGVIDPEFVNERGKTIEFHAKALPYLERLIEDAEEDGVSLKVISGYRSFTTQAQLKSSYRVTYGSGANAFSADQGYSEHQLGTALDFTTSKPIGKDLQAAGGKPVGFDANWIVKGDPHTLRPVARLKDPKSGRVLELSADQPGVQFYSGNFLDGSNKGKGGVVYQQYTGLCLESQKFPNSINVPAWKDEVILKPGATYKHSMVHKFSAE